MERAVRFEHNRWLGDKRTQIVHDVDACDDPSTITELIQPETFLSFAPGEPAQAPDPANRAVRAARPPTARHSATPTQPAAPTAKASRPWSHYGNHRLQNASAAGSSSAR